MHFNKIVLQNNFILSSILLLRTGEIQTLINQINKNVSTQLEMRLEQDFFLFLLKFISFYHLIRTLNEIVLHLKCLIS